MRMIRLFPVLAAVLLVLSACGPAPEERGGRILKISPGKKIASLDPALAADTASQYIARRETMKTGMASIRLVTIRSILSESFVPFSIFLFLATHACANFWMNS